MDTAGRVSRSIEGYEYVTSGGFALETDQISNAKENFTINIPKWENSNIKHLQEIANFIKNNVILCFAVCVDKRSDLWSQFWEDAESYHQKVSSDSKMRTGFVKAANLIRYWLFQQCAAPLLAEVIKRSPSPRISDYTGLELIEVDVVCDSDIQGQDNIEAFEDCWKQYEKSQDKTNQLGLRILLRDVKIQTEESEPLLYISDYIAGISHAKYGIGESALPDNISIEDINDILNKINEEKKIIILKKSFDLNYPEIFKNFEYS